MSIQRQIFANYSQSISKLQLTDSAETLISSADLVKVKGQAKLDFTLLVREAATGITYTLEFNEESSLLNGSAGIYCIKDSKESVVSLTITEFAFTGYSETGDGHSITKLDPYNSPVYNSLASLPLASANGNKPWNAKVVVPGQYEIEYSSDGSSFYGRGHSALLSDRPSAVTFGKGEWTVGNVGATGSIWLSNGVSWSSSGPIVLAQSAIPMCLPASSRITDNGAFQLGTKVGGGTATFSATSGTVTCTLSLAGFLGTSVDVGKVVTVDNGKQFTITAFGTTTTATGTLSATLSGLGPHTDWTLSRPFFTVYSDIYFYFPTNAIYAGSSAGWYYSVMSSTTTGTIYNNVYTTGDLSVPVSPTPFVTTGPGEFVQPTGTSIVGFNFDLLGGVIGPNGSMDVWIDAATTGGSLIKRTDLYFDSFPIHLHDITSPVYAPHRIIIQNRNSQVRQKVTRSNGGSEVTHTSSNGNYRTVDTSVTGKLKIAFNSAEVSSSILIEAFKFEVSSQW